MRSSVVLTVSPPHQLGHDRRVVVAVEPELVQVGAFGGGELARGEDVVVAVAVAAGAVFSAEGVAVGAVDGAVGVGEAVVAESLDDAAFGRQPAGLELGA